MPILKFIIPLVRFCIAGFHVPIANLGGWTKLEKMFKILVAEKEKNLKFKSPIFFVAQPVSFFCFVSFPTKVTFIFLRLRFRQLFFRKVFFYIFYSRWRFRFQSLGTEAALSDWLGPWNRKKEKQQQQWSRRRFETETERHNGLITRRHSNINSMKTCKLVDSKTRVFLQIVSSIGINDSISWIIFSSHYDRLVKK